MREIKFRAWDKSFKAMRKVTMVNFYNSDIAVEVPSDTIYMSGERPTSQRLLRGGRYELMQYTGLKDKNGVEIYEGDVLEVYDRKGENPIANVEVYWNNGYWDAKDSRDDYFRSCYAGFSKNKIIGNIHENPELIK